jgi:putative integral membrane protein (TIGR02587 family)
MEQTKSAKKIARSDKVPGGEEPAWIGIGRAVGGAIIFSLPIMMTMEMWWIGFYIEPLRLLLLILLSLPLFYGISTMVGFRNSKTFFDNVVDVLVAYAVTFITTGILLFTFGVIAPGTHIENIFCMLLLQAVPGSLGALLARNVVGDNSLQSQKDSRRYSDELTILATGALFLAFNISPTEEMALISYRMATWQTLILVMITLVVMQAFAVARSDLNTSDFGSWRTHWLTFFRFTAIGYLFAIAISLFMLWVFGNLDDHSFHNTIKIAIVLGFPAGVGAAAARMII